MNWVNELYAETIEKWKKAGSDKSGFAIFYSPVIENAKIVLIGYNPGGTETPDLSEIKVPVQHEYAYQKYRLAEKVRKIFESAELSHELNNTVKFNLIFFRSRKANDFQNQELIRYSEEKVLQILERINPPIIITEGFKTFDRLLQLKNGVEEESIYLNSRRIIRVGAIQQTRIIGLLHPSGARGVSDMILTEMGKVIKSYFDKLS